MNFIIIKFYNKINNNIFILKNLNFILKKIIFLKKFEI